MSEEKRRFKRFGEESKELPRSRTPDHALVSSFYLPVRPTANLTIGNESKKITSVAFVPDGVQRVARLLAVTRQPSKRHEATRCVETSLGIIHTNFF